MIRWLPLTTALRLLSGFGKLEYRLHKHLRKAFQQAVSEARETLECDWDVPTISQELAGNQVLWRTRDMLLDGGQVVAERRSALHISLLTPASRPPQGRQRSHALWAERLRLAAEAGQ